MHFALERKREAFGVAMTHTEIVDGEPAGVEEPELLAEIEYRAKSAEGKGRLHSSRACEGTCDGEGLPRVTRAAHGADHSIPRGGR
jgi:hypothetical protein